MISTATNISPELLSRLKAAFAAATLEQIREAVAGLEPMPVTGGKGRGNAPPRLELRELVTRKSLAWVALRHLAAPIQKARGPKSVVMVINADLATAIAQRLKFLAANQEGS